MMGCDIHAYVEYADKDREKPYWMALATRCNPGRDYQLFAKLAGVRTDNEKDQIIPLRGSPGDVSLTVQWENQLYVSDEGSGEDTCTAENAARWVESGASEWANERRTAVTNPDYHSHSWCTPAEFRAVLEAPQSWPVRSPYWAVLASMEEFERRDCLARLVFWFDN